MMVEDTLRLITVVPDHWGEGEDWIRTTTCWVTNEAVVDDHSPEKVAQETDARKYINETFLKMLVESGSIPLEVPKPIEVVRGKPVMLPTGPTEGSFNYLVFEAKVLRPDGP